MKTLIWRLRDAVAFRRLADLSWGLSWHCAGTILESRDDYSSPLDAVSEELTYWHD